VRLPPSRLILPLCFFAAPPPLALKPPLPCPMGSNRSTSSSYSVFCLSLPPSLFLPRFSLPLFLTYPYILHPCMPAPLHAFLHARQPPELVLLVSPPATSIPAAQTALFVVAPSTPVTLLPTLLNASSGAVLQSLPPTRLPRFVVPALLPGTTYTLSLSCVDDAGNTCAQPLILTWSNAPCPAGREDAVTGLRSQSLVPGERVLVWDPVSAPGGGAACDTGFEYSVDEGAWVPVPASPPGSLPSAVVRSPAATAAPGPRHFVAVLVSCDKAVMIGSLG
jgi:hypothetical protein